MKKEGYFIEWNGEFWQSVFPSSESELSQLHTSIEDAFDYMQEVKPDCGPILLRAKWTKS